MIFTLDTVIIFLPDIVERADISNLYSKGTLIGIKNILCMFSKFLRCMFYRPDWLTLYVLNTLYVFKKNGYYYYRGVLVNNYFR